MFSGIIESKGYLRSIEKTGSNLSFYIESDLTPELSPDQSLAHNGVCLTVEEVSGDQYRVTAVEETLLKTNIGDLEIGEAINLERCLSLGDRLDGHIVQGHVDTVATCVLREDRSGSWIFRFQYPAESVQLLVEKGSIAVNGVSLTAFDCRENCFSVTIIPYTLQHTNFNALQPGDTVNIEFDILGKYFLKWAGSYAGLLADKASGKSSLHSGI
jgi:riboflavin synthase